MRTQQPLPCPCCDSASLTQEPAVQKFVYGEAPYGVELQADVVVTRCLDCGEEFTDCTAETARHEAVLRHLAGTET